MIPLASRSTRLSRHILRVQLVRTSLPVRRTFTSSIIHQHDHTGKTEKVHLTTAGEPTTQTANENLQSRKSQLGQNAQSVHEARGKKKPSRLAALKKRNRDGVTSEVESNGAEPTQRYILGQSADKPIRTRFAPSPTGYLHLGSLRTALFNNLVAQATKGEERIFSDLEWAGLSWTEGPDKGGPYAPYRQSERLDIYKDHVKTLVDNGSAYRCFCKSSVLEAQKRALHDAGKSTVYPGTCRSVPRSESDDRAAAGKPHVVRLDSARFGMPKFKDAIYGPFQKKEPEEDFVLMKTDGYPTYHLANVVDDHLMKITHVIRGEEWLISTPKHLALYEAFGWEPPTFAHLGLLISNDGSKLSKRNDSVNLSTYMNQKTFPMALQAWLANLGASFKRGAQAPRFLKDVAEALTFKFTRGGIKLNPQKLDFFQHEYRNLLFKTPLSEHTPREQALIRENLLTPLANEVLAITASSESAADSYIPIHPRGASLIWPGPLTPVPAMISSELAQQAYAFQVLTQESTRYPSVVDIARLLPYFFWRPPPAIYRAALATDPIRRDLFNLVYEAVHASPDTWELALDRLLERVPSHQAPELHAILRLIAVGSPHAVGKASRVLFSVLGQDEWRFRTALMRLSLDELDLGGQALRQRWLDEAAPLKAKDAVVDK
ncbi:hypothetical protein FZEAL_2330 [Fusarium zealandicum]|uniref:Glutamyl/glutaminyl-tRNA synthetase class Ib catalytic domain-containing protein n=1 Tax=Fusarium zealandicum TaxID=1053134 RepID=A0A8H4UR06_9HYPO|nr:hypothetical protein FZEAL_2330 [Fusarium zealandicum]